MSSCRLGRLSLATECSVSDGNPIGARLPQLRIGGAQILQQLTDRGIGEPAAIVDIFHVALLAGIELVKQRIAFAVEDQLPDAESLAQLRVERGRDLEQSVI